MQLHNATRLLPSSSLKMAHRGALFANILRGSNGSTKRFLAKFTESLSPDWPDDDEGQISDVPRFLSALLDAALDEDEIRFDVILGTARHLYHDISSGHIAVEGPFSPDMAPYKSTNIRPRDS